jgi:hypothetical protein
MNWQIKNQIKMDENPLETKGTINRCHICKQMYVSCSYLMQYYFVINWVSLCSHAYDTSGFFYSTCILHVFCQWLTVPGSGIGTWRMVGLRACCRECVVTCSGYDLTLKVSPQSWHAVTAWCSSTCVEKRAALCKTSARFDQCLVCKYR